MPPREEKPEDPPKTRRRWKRRLVYGLLVLIGFLIWANGPGIRWGLKKVISQQIAAQDLSGSFKVEGTALSGISIRDLSLNGKSTIQSVKSNLIQVEWSLGSLIDQELEGITLNRLHLVVDPKAPKPAGAPSPEAPEDSSDSGTSLADTLNLVRGFIQPAKISVTDLNVEIVEVTQVSLASISHTAGEFTYLISDLRSVDHLDRPVHNPQSTLTWNEDGFAIDQVTLNPRLAIHDLSFKPERSASLIISVAESEILVKSDLASSHRILLQSPALSIPDLIQLAKPGIEATGEITQLEINTATGLVTFEGQNLKYQDQEISRASVEATTKDLLSPFEQPINLEIAIDEKLKVDGFVELDQSILDSSAELNLVVNWPEVPIVNAEFAYDSREARIIANTLDDLRATARFQVDPQTYQAEILGRIKDASDLEKRLEAPLEFTATANGDLKSAKHSGTLNLETLGFRQPDFPEAIGRGKITWNWPESVNIETLEMTTPEASAQASLSWSNDTLNIRHIKLFEGTDELLLVQASLPAPLETRSLDDLLESPEKISMEISTKPLTFERLASFLPIPENLTGVLQLTDLKLAGTLENPALDGEITLKGFSSASTPDLPPADLDLAFETSDEKLSVNLDAKDAEGQLLKIDGVLPFLPRQWIDLKTIPLDTPISLVVSNDSLDLRRIQPFVPTLPGIKGKLDLEFSLSGTIETPVIGGNLNLSGFNTTLQNKLPDLGLNVKLVTENRTLALSGSAQEGRDQFFTVAGKLPLEAGLLTGRAKELPEKPISLDITGARIDLVRIRPFVPQIQLIRGDLAADVSVSGTLSKPEITGNALLRIEKMRLKDSPISDFKDTRIQVDYAEDIVTISEGRIVASGGKADLKGTIDLRNRKPEFDPVFNLSLDGKFILLYRNKDFTFRGHPNLRVEGPLSKANVSGTLEIADSLIYKDVEILPLGVPRTTEIPRPNLPSFSQKPVKKQQSRPQTGIMTWGLQIDVKIEDPILIRGNLVKGSVTGQNLRIRGTIGDPQTSGTLVAKDLEADLPFSTLEVQTAVVTLRPDALTNPYFDIRGSSEISSHLIQVYLSGSVQNHNLVLTSDPPLPESEILLLLATGSSSAQLADQQIASQKALQYLFETLRRRNGEKDKSVFQRLLKNSDQIELSLGETNQYSGRNFSSTTLDLGDHFDFTTQIDEQGQTRALVVFSIRFK